MVAVSLRQLSLLVAVSVVALVVPTHAERTSSSRPAQGMSFFSRVEKTLGLSSEQKEAVRGVLQKQREELQVVRDTNKTQRESVYARSNDTIRGLLTPAQQPKWDAFIQAEKQKRAEKYKNKN